MEEKKERDCLTNKRRGEKTKQTKRKHVNNVAGNTGTYIQHGTYVHFDKRPVTKDHAEDERCTATAVKV